MKLLHVKRKNNEGLVRNYDTLGVKNEGLVWNYDTFSVKKWTFSLKLWHVKCKVMTI